MGTGIDVDPGALRSHAATINEKVKTPVQDAGAAANEVGGGDILSYGLVNIQPALMAQALGGFAQQIIESAAGMAALVSATVEDIASAYEESDEAVASDMEQLESEMGD